MKIFNINKKQNRIQNLLAIEEIIKRQLTKQQTLLKQWNDNFIESLENFTMEKVETPADPYAEQRKWIGKICKFWNWDTGLAHYSKLITIKDINDGEVSNCPFRADDGGWYMYCEPVKPDDDIIYKGGDNE